MCIVSARCLKMRNWNSNDRQRKQTLNANNKDNVNFKRALCTFNIKLTVTFKQVCLSTIFITNSMELKPWEANSRSASREISLPFHNFSSYFPSIHSNIIFPSYFKDYMVWLRNFRNDFIARLKGATWLHRSKNMTLHASIFTSHDFNSLTPVVWKLWS